MINNSRALIFVVLAACAPANPTPPGYQGVVEYEERIVAFEVAGTIEKVGVARGDHVEKGTALAHVDDTLERLSRDAKREDVEVAKADLALVSAPSRPEDVAQVAAQVRAAQSSETLLVKALDRSRSLLASGSVAQAELDRSAAELDRASYERKALEQRLALIQRGARREEIERAKARVEASQSALALADARLARHDVRASQAGIVLDVHVQGGELAGPGVPVATVADVAHPFVEMFVPEGEIGGIKVGTRAEVRTDSTAAPLGGKVEHIASRAEFTPRFLFSEQERPNLVIRVRVRVDDPKNEVHAGTPAFVRMLR